MRISYSFVTIILSLLLFIVNDSYAEDDDYSFENDDVLRSQAFRRISLQYSHLNRKQRQELTALAIKEEKKYKKIMRRLYNTNPFLDNRIRQLRGKLYRQQQLPPAELPQQQTQQLLPPGQPQERQELQHEPQEEVQQPQAQQPIQSQEQQPQTQQQQQLQGEQPQEVQQPPQEQEEKLKSKRGKRKSGTRKPRIKKTKQDQ